VLFEGGAGETIRRNLLHDCDVHTLLRLPTGIFHAQGVKANVIFFDRKPASETPWTKKLWVDDLRTNAHFTLKTNPLKRADLDDFMAFYRAENRHQRRATWSDKKPEGQWRSYDYKEIVARDKCSLDVFWLKDESLEATQNLPPHVLACPCGGRRAIVADISEGEGVVAILAHLGLPTEEPPIARARSPGFDFTYTGTARAAAEGATTSRGRRCAARTTCARFGGSAAWFFRRSATRRRAREGSWLRDWPGLA